MELTLEVILVVDFQGRTLRGHCEFLSLSANTEQSKEIVLDVHQSLKIEEVSIADCRCDFKIEVEDEWQKLVVSPDSACHEVQLQVQFIVLPGSPALWWHPEDALVVANQVLARTLLPWSEDTMGRLACKLSFFVPVGMTAVCCGHRIDTDHGKAVENYQAFTFVMKSIDLAFVLGELQVHQGSCGIFAGQSQTPFASFQAAQEESERLLIELLSRLERMAAVQDGTADISKLQAALLPDQSLPHGGVGLPGLVLLPASWLPCDQGGASFWVSFQVVKALLGISRRGVSFDNLWIVRGLELLVWHKLVNEVHGNGGDFLLCSTLLGSGRWMGQLTDPGYLDLPKDIAMFSWLQRSEAISNAALDDFICHLAARGRESPLSKEDLTVITHKCLPGLAEEWPSVDWCLENLHAHCMDLQSQPAFQEVQKVLQAWQKLVPTEAVGSPEALVSKLIIRTAIHVKVKWSTFQKCYFLEQLLEMAIYREYLIRMGNAYGFDTMKNVDLLSRWCMLLVKHNCQDHIEVLKRFLERQSNFIYTTELFHLVTDRASVDTRWKFIAQELWESSQPHFNTQLQGHIFQILNKANCIGQF